ncbi:serine/threonine-protein kinase PAK 7-like [Notothenia coriiceps]|uniref:non-specific serine/threonine protein kinase n=1 Tax=Notothenia coriiceps TaxID=8208 RepID=A0A6I9P1Y0_9TELE|nr:PREDICTED: serine/threonine-protein kinase PAK 7-like [Notothenia coriiceps]
MFGKKKKRLEISAPSNFEHRVHTGFDPREQKFTGLPQQWQSLLADTANRPKPMVDPSYITPIQLAPMKISPKNVRSSETPLPKVEVVCQLEQENDSTHDITTLLCQSLFLGLIAPLHVFHVHEPPTND